MITLEAVIARMMELETKYYDLQAKYQELIHEHEELKEVAACCHFPDCGAIKLKERYEDECG